MAVITYSIVNNSVDTAAVINSFEITTNVSEIQHYLNLTGWNEPWNTGYTNFTGSTTLREETKTFSVEYSGKNGIIDTFYSTGSWVHFLESPAQYFNEVDTVQSGWDVIPSPGSAYESSGVTVSATSGTGWISFSSIWDNDPVPGDVISMAPADNRMIVSNTTNIESGWIVSGNGYSGGQTVVQVIDGVTLEISDPPSTRPTSGASINFQSTEDQMITIPPGETRTFDMDYTNVTSTLGTYTSLVTINATQGSAVQKTVNNFLLISAAPVTDPVSPYYDPTVVYTGDGGGIDAGPADCGDAATAAGLDCDAGGSCFLGNTLIKMFDGTEKPISEIQRGDLVLDALNTNQGNRVLGVKVMMSPLGRYLFSPVKDIEPFMTEEHPYYDSTGQVCAISDLAKELAPWFKDIVVCDTDNKYEMVSPTPVYNLFLETGHTHFANGIPVDNIVGNGGTYILYYLGLIDYETYSAHARNTERADYSPQMKVFYRKFLNLLGNYVLTHDNWLSKKMLEVGVYSLTNKSKTYGRWHKFAKSPVGKLLTRLL